MCEVKGVDHNGLTADDHHQLLFLCPSHSVG